MTPARLSPEEAEAIRKRVKAFGTQPDPGCTQRNADIIALLADRDATMEVGTREALVALMMECVRQEPVKSDRMVTIDELEAMLNSDDPEQICLAPDGGIMTRPKPLTVGALADKILSRFTLAGGWRPIAEELYARWRDEEAKERRVSIADIYPWDKLTEPTKDKWRKIVALPSPQSPKETTLKRDIVVDAP